MAVLELLSAAAGAGLTVVSFIFNLPDYFKPVFIAFLLYFVGGIVEYLLENILGVSTLLGLSIGVFRWVLIFAVLVLGYLPVIFGWYRLWGIGSPPARRD